MTMQESAPRSWSTWRLTLNRRPAPGPHTHDVLLDRMANTTPPDRDPCPAVPDELKQEAPNQNGIREGLVNHVRRLIEAGEYDTPERWELAQERMLERVSRGR